MVMDLSSDELLAIARMRGTSIGKTVTICGYTYRMCVNDSGSEFLHLISEAAKLPQVA
jgi:hypothetical protein